MTDRRTRKRLWVGFVAAVVFPALTAVLLPSPAMAHGPQDFPAAQLVSWTSGRCLDVDAGTAGLPRTNVQLFTCRALSDPVVGYQIFDRVSIAGRPSWEFRIRNQQTGKCLTYNVGGGTGSPVWAEACSRPGQGWTRRELATNVTQFVAVQSSNMCLDTVDINGGQRSGIDLWNCSAQINSNRWIVN